MTQQQPYLPLKGSSLLNFTIYDFAVVGSTNDEVKVLLAQGAGEGTVVRAETQTAGRGRRGKQWISQPGNLYCSFLLMPECSLIQACQLSFVMAVAVGNTLIPFLKNPHVLSYKWPNDILLQKEKVAGILIETESQGGQLAEACIVGIGVNLNSLPDHPAYPVTTLRNHTKSNLILDALFSELLMQIKKTYQLWQKDGFDVIRKAWLERAFNLGEELIINLGKKEVRGQFMGLSEEGALLLKERNGFVHKLTSAEIS